MSEAQIPAVSLGEQRKYPADDDGRDSHDESKAIDHYEGRAEIVAAEDCRVDCAIYGRIVRERQRCNLESSSADVEVRLVEYQGPESAQSMEA